MEFLHWVSYLEGIFRDFSCLLYLAAQEDKLLVGGSAGALTCVVCLSDPRSASAICYSGGDRAVFHAAMKKVVVDTEDILV